MRPVLDAFERVGTSEPVTLSRKEKGELLEVIESWVTQVPGGYPEMPDGIFDLRNALEDDLYDTAGSTAAVGA